MGNKNFNDIAGSIMKQAGKEWTPHRTKATVDKIQKQLSFNDIASSIMKEAGHEWTPAKVSKPKKTSKAAKVSKAAINFNDIASSIMKEAGHEWTPKKVSKRMKKKLAKTGRTSTKQKIKPPLNKPSSELPKVGPRPSSPKLPPKKTPEQEAGIRGGEEILQDEKSRLRQFLINMINSSDELTEEQKKQIEEKLRTADPELLEDIRDIFEDDGQNWKDFYRYTSDTAGEFVEYDDYVAALQTVMDVLDIKY